MEQKLPAIVHFPDPVLKQKVRPVAQITKDIRELVKVMRRVMTASQGIGLAANQIGIPLSLFVAQHKGKFYAFINPKITAASKAKGPMAEGESQFFEGCLSVPGYWGVVPRHLSVTVEGLSPAGKKQKVEADGVLAHIFQHEVDHLEGKVFLEKAKHVYKMEHGKRPVQER